ncbi:glycerophosphodiester phosphodiesterase family protein [uncultured Shewanella sp.]|uniref:glycerophosphodiester phosphodiesterase n=1 Tax=uncultured Shewanella sp. TaxID=173975 RepID=UPI0026090BF0|nr:glycerophosphodiester phosphodiesterase family protein [uncultured Shewanella sp.]
MASYIKAPRRYYAVLLIALFALIGCQSTPDAPPAPAKVIPQALSHLPFDVKVDGVDMVDIQLALGDRNLYLSDNGHIKMVSIAQCPLDISAHRGDFRLPESSDLAIASALFDNYNSVEIDVMQLGDGTWVNHHDSQTGRATVYYTGERYKLERMNLKQYAKLKLRQKGSNELLDRRPITAYEAFTTFAAYRSYDQLLNVEIKSEANGHELVELDNMLRQTIGQGGFYYSASDLEMLEKLRGINPRVYLGFVQGAHPTSVDKVTADLRRGAQNDDYYLDNQNSIEFAGKYGTKRYRSRYKNYASSSGIKMLNDKLGANSGLHLDIRSFMQNTSVLNSAHRYGMKVYTYTINGTDYHQSQLKRLAKSKLPDGVIVDTTPYKICQKLFNAAVPKKRYQPLTASGRYIASLPSDADFDRFNEMLGYQQEGYYISLNSGLKAIASAKAKPKKVNKQTHASNPHGFPTIIDEQIETTNSKTIILTLPSSNND